MSGSVFKTMVKSYMYYQASQNHEQIKACEVCTLLNIKRIFKKLNYKWTFIFHYVQSSLHANYRQDGFFHESPQGYHRKVVDKTPS